MSTAPSAAAAIARRCSAAARCRVLGIDRDPEAMRRGAALAASHHGPADPDRGPVWRHGAAGRPARRRARSPASRSISASRRCSSTAPSAASRSASTARSTCAWDAMGRAPPIWSRELPESELADIDPRTRRGALRPPRRPRNRHGAPAAAPIRRTGELAEIVRARDPAARARPRSRRRAPFRRCASRSTTSSASSTAASPPPSGC